MQELLFEKVLRVCKEIGCYERKYIKNIMMNLF